MGDEALGLITALHYSQALDNPANAKFSRAFEASAGKIASYYSEATYTNARWIVEAIKAVGGKAEDRDALLAALRRRSEERRVGKECRSRGSREDERKK